MKINKIAIKPNKIGIDIVLCPKTNLYLQDLYCRRCAYFESDNVKFVQCNFTGHKYGQSDPIKDQMIKDLSQSFISELPIDNEKKTINNFTERLKSYKTGKTKDELMKEGLSQYMKKTNLSTRLDNIKKSPSKKSAHPG